MLVHADPLFIDCTVLINREIATSGSRFLRACRPGPSRTQGVGLPPGAPIGMRLV